MFRVIKYGASWCHQCKQLDREFERTKLNCQLDKVDINDLSDKEVEDLKIKTIPVTILWDYDEDSASWIEIRRWIGFVRANEINKMLK